MFYSKKNKLGKIEFNEKIIGNVVRKAAHKFEGKVKLSDSKGRIRKNSLKDRNSENITFMDIKDTEAGYVIEIFLVLKFGTSIRETSDELIKIIKEQLWEVTELKITKVKITVTGMLSKNLSKRHIEVTG